MAVKNYTELIAWQKAMDLAVAVYAATEAYPQREVFGLANQMRRAAVFIPSNIAEGQGRATTKDFVHFLAVSRGSLQELETQAILSHRLQFISDPTRDGLLNASLELTRILHGLINSLSASV